MPRKVLTKPEPPAGPVFDYSKSRIAFKRSYDEFLQFLGGYPDSTGVCAYLYRLWPVVDLKRLCPPGQEDSKWPTNIEKTIDLDLLDPSAVAERHGSGEYMVKVSDSNRARGETEVCRAWLNINNPELAPMLDVRTLVLAHPKNESYVQALVAAGKLELIDGRASIPRSSMAAASTAGPVVNGGGLDARLARIEVALDGKLTATPDTLGTLHQMRELKGLLDSMAGPARVDDLDRLEKLAKVLRSVNATTEAAPVPVDPIESYRKVKDLLSDIAPAAAAVAGDGWGSIIRDIAVAAPALAQTFLILRNAGAGRAAPAVHPSGPVLPAAAVPVAAVVPEPEPAMVPFMAPLPEGFDVRMLTNDPSRMARLMQVAEQAVGKFRQKVKGFDYAYALYWTEPDGPAIYNVCETIATDGDGEVSAKPLLMLFALHPSASDLLFSRSAELETWLEDFLAFVPVEASTAA